jgi:hypothetical protein
MSVYITCMPMSIAVLPLFYAMQHPADAAGDPMAQQHIPISPLTRPTLPGPTHSSMCSSSCVVLPDPAAAAAEHVPCSAAPMCCCSCTDRGAGCTVVCWPELPTRGCCGATATVSLGLHAVACVLAVLVPALQPVTTLISWLCSGWGGA